MVEEGESHACGVWLIDEDGSAAICGWRTSRDRLYTLEERDGWDALDAAAREHGEPSLRLHAGLERRPSSTQATIRACPSRFATFNREAGVESLVVTPLVLGSRTLGWMTISHVPEPGVRRLVARRAARGDRASGDAGAAPEPPGRAQPARGAPQGHPRGAQPARARHSRQPRAGVRRDPDAAAGGAARGRHAAGRGRVEHRDRGRSGPHASDRGAAIGRHAAAERRPRRGRRDGAQAAGRSRAAHDQRADRGHRWRSCRASATASSGRSSASRRRR